MFLFGGGGDIWITQVLLRSGGDQLLLLPCTQGYSFWFTGHYIQFQNSNYNQLQL